MPQGQPQIWIFFVCEVKPPVSKHHPMQTVASCIPNIGSCHFIAYGTSPGTLWLGGKVGLVLTAGVYVVAKRAVTTSDGNRTPGRVKSVVCLLYMECILITIEARGVKVCDTVRLE